MNEQLAHNKINQAIQLLEKGQPVKARDNLQRVLKFYPNSPQLHFLLGLTLIPLAAEDAALHHFNQAIELEPHLLEAYINRGILLKKKGKLQKALNDFDYVIQHNPSIVQAYTNRGNVRILLKQLTLASEDFARAIQLDPLCEDALLNMGMMLVSEGAYLPGLPLLKRALELNPDLLEAKVALGTALGGLGRHEEAIEMFSEVILTQPKHVDARCGLANSLAACGNIQDAEFHFNQALQLYPQNASARNGKAVMLMNIGKYSESYLLFKEAIALDPEFHLAQFNLSLLLLLQGDYTGGWLAYESRKFDLLVRRRCGIRKMDGKEWQGEDLSNKKLLLHQEQGLGDTLQMLRYIPLLQKKNAQLSILLDPPLINLVKENYPDVVICQNIQSLPDYDSHCPMMSLPLHFSTQLDNIPSEKSYLKVDESRLQHWSEKIGTTKRLRVGLAWSGSRQHINDRQRSLAFDQLKPLLAMNAEFHSLQKEYREDRSNLEINCIFDHSAQLQDMTDTAALIMQLDLIITVDTSVAHLAAALGKPCWIILATNPDFRWGLESEHSPWYPSVLLFRGSAQRNWTGVIDDVCEKLQTLLGLPN